MNLQTEIGLVRQEIAEPGRADQSDNFITDYEIVDWINQAEIQVAKDLHYQALPSLQTAGAITTTPATDSYSLASNYMRLIGARYNTVGNDTARLREVRFVDPTTFHSVKTSPNFRRCNYDKPYGTIIDNKVWFWPYSDSGGIGGGYLRYIKRPSKRTKFFKFACTNATTTSIESGNVGSRVNEMATNAWVGANMRAVSRGMWGEEHAVTSSSPTNGVFGFTAADIWSVNAVLGTEFEVGETSDCPQDLYPMWVKFAAFLALCKDRAQEAQAKLVEYKAMVANENMKWGSPPTVETGLMEVTK